MIPLALRLVFLAKGLGFTALRGVADARADFGRLDPNAKPSQTEGLFFTHH